MTKSRKERTMAIVIGLIMIFSMGGFALSSVVYLQPPAEEVMPSIVNRALTPQEKIGILQTGRVLIEDFYAENCTECADLGIMLSSFVEAFKDYAVLEVVVANETEVKMIGTGGQIRDIPLNVTQEGLMDIFCELAILQPTECLLREY